MTYFRVNAGIFYFDRLPAGGVIVQAQEDNGRIYRIEVTDEQGHINRDIRQKRQLLGLGNLDDPRDQPSFSFIISDPEGHSFTTIPYPYFAIDNLHIDLPKDFPNLKASSLAKQSLNQGIGQTAPGHTFMVRKSGAVWVEAAGGFAARVGGLRPKTSKMTNDTIIQMASMSKPICATAIIAMIEDWQSIQDDIRRLKLGEPVKGQTLSFRRRLAFSSTLLGSFNVPNVIAPLFTSKKIIADFESMGYFSDFPRILHSWLVKFSENKSMTVDPVPAIPPGHFGLLRRVLQGITPPDLSRPFLPLIRSRLESTAVEVQGMLQIGDEIDQITTDQLLSHFGRLPNGLTDPALQGLPGWMEAQPVEPNDGSHVTYNLWPYLLMLLRQNATGDGTVYNYRNDNYTVLGGIIEACTEISYDDYVTGRLFNDPRFSKIRRYVVDKARSALYYNGVGPNWVGGLPFPDYRGFSADGGWYCTASQITDWLHVLYTSEPVSGVLGSKPLLSPSNRQTLFSLPGYFSPNGIDNLPNGVIGFRHNGSTGDANHKVNGKFSVFLGPDSQVHTAFLAINGNRLADPQFDNAMSYLVQSGEW